MIIAHGDERKHIILYPPTQYPPLQSWLESGQESIQPILSNS